MTDAAPREVRVWDAPVRVVHWSLAAVVIADLLNDASANAWHRGLGYAALGLVALRLAWGVVGPPGVKLAAMWRTAGDVRAYVFGRAHRDYVAHNPLGALMAFALWSAVAVTGASGWMLQLEAYWGDETVEAVHAAAAYTLAGLALVHVTGAVIASVRERTNLVKAMITGTKRIRH